MITQMRWFNRFKVVGTFFLFLVFLGCAPKVYVIDRQTVLHEYAAGEWPHFENTMSSNAILTKPSQLPPEVVHQTDKNKKLYNVLNGEMESKK